MGALTYAVAANTGASSRVGTMTIAGITFTVTQAANSCTHTLSATSASVPAAGTTSGAVSVSTGTSCSWTAVSNDSWITITSGANGTGIGSVAYSVALNPTDTQRVGTMTIAGTTFTVTQAALTISPPTGVTIVK
jgi:Viral BACON domain